MQFAVPSQFRSHVIPPSLPSRLRAAACCGAMMALMPLALHAADNNLATIDPSMIATLQLRAEQAAPRDQMQLFADLADKISLLATKQIADGNDEQAQATLKQLEACTTQMEITLKLDSKGVKRAEMLLHTTNRRLKDLVREASGDMKPVVQSALKRLDQAQTTLLSAVFAK